MLAKVKEFFDERPPNRKAYPDPLIMAGQFANGEKPTKETAHKFHRIKWYTTNLSCF